MRTIKVRVDLYVKVPVDDVDELLEENMNISDSDDMITDAILDGMVTGISNIVVYTSNFN